MQKHVASCWHAQGGAHSYLLALVFDCTLSIRSLVHISSEPQSLVKGTWNDRKVVLNILTFPPIRRPWRVIHSKRVCILLKPRLVAGKTWRACTSEKLQWKTVIMTRPGAPCYFKWVKIAIPFEVSRRPLLFSPVDPDLTAMRHLQRIPRHWQRTDPAPGSRLRSSARFPLSNWGSWQSLAPPVEDKPMTPQT